MPLIMMSMRTSLFSILIMGCVCSVSSVGNVSRETFGVTVLLDIPYPSFLVADVRVVQKSLERPDGAACPLQDRVLGARQTAGMGCFQEKEKPACPQTAKKGTEDRLLFP